MIELNKDLNLERESSAEVLVQKLTKDQDRDALDYVQGCEGHQTPLGSLHETVFSIEDEEESD